MHLFITESAKKKSLSLSDGVIELLLEISQRPETSISGPFGIDLSFGVSTLEEIQDTIYTDINAYINSVTLPETEVALLKKDGSDPVTMLYPGNAPAPVKMTEPARDAYLYFERALFDTQYPVVAVLPELADLSSEDLAEALRYINRYNKRIILGQDVITYLMKNQLLSKVVRNQLQTNHDEYSRRVPKSNRVGIAFGETTLPREFVNEGIAFMRMKKFDWSRGVRPVTNIALRVAEIGVEAAKKDDMLNARLREILKVLFDTGELQKIGIDNVTIQNFIDDPKKIFHFDPLDDDILTRIEVEFRSSELAATMA